MFYSKYYHCLKKSKLKNLKYEEDCIK